MNNQSFTLRAAILRAGIPQTARHLFLTSIHCVKCPTVTEMMSISGRVERGDLILGVHVPI